MVINRIKNISFTFLLFGLFSCTDIDDESKQEIYLWDLKDCNYCMPNNIYITANTLYFSNKKQLKKRLLVKHEQDTLALLIKMMDANRINSTYYEYLSSYDYMIDLSITRDGKQLLNTSVYDDKLPEGLEELYDYLNDISRRDGLLDVNGKYSNRFKEVLISGLVNDRRDTLYPSHESSFQIWKRLVETNDVSQKNANTPKDIKYEILFDYLYVFDDTIRDIEKIGLTESGTLFFKLKNKEQYFYMPFKHNVKFSPSFLGPEL